MQAEPVVDLAGLVPLAPNLAPMVDEGMAATYTEADCMVGEQEGAVTDRDSLEAAGWGGAMVAAAAAEVKCLEATPVVAA